jgi:hypothetical protein
MFEPVNLLLAGAGASAFLGFAWLALAMDVHWASAHGQSGPSPHYQRLLRRLGSMLLAASLMLCMASDHATMAVLVWTMLLAGAALLVAILLSWWPRSLRALWRRA